MEVEGEGGRVELEFTFFSEMKGNSSPAVYEGGSCMSALTSFWRLYTG